MDKKIENILNLYENILFNKKICDINEVTDSYNNIDFKDNVVGNSKPSRDNINTSLLNDIEIAAKNAGVKVDVTTAVSGHNEKTSSGNTSRHTTGNAVDISIINGKSVRSLDKNIIDKFVNELVKLGYVRGSESGNPKAVLDYTFKGGGHDNHIHVSRTDKGSSDVSSVDNTSSTTTSTDIKDPLLYQIGKNIGQVLYPKQMTESLSFGKNIKNQYGTVLIPKDSNSKIKSPVSGIVDNTRYSSGCKNQITIKINGQDSKYLQFCGITNPSVRDGESIIEGQLLGQTKDDVEVTLFDPSFKRISLTKNTKISDKKQKPEYKDEIKKDVSTKRYKDPVLAALAQIPFKPFENQYDESGKMKEKRIGLSTDTRPVDPWILNLLKKPFETKVNENVERIKKLL